MFFFTALLVVLFLRLYDNAGFYYVYSLSKVENINNWDSDERIVPQILLTIESLQALYSNSLEA